MSCPVKPPASGGRFRTPGGWPACPAHPRVRGRRVPVLPGRARLRGRLLRRPRRAPGHRPGARAHRLAVALTVDAALLLLFAVQHTVMARPWFKRRWTRLVPAPAERATFVLAATAALALLLWCWQPVGGTLWQPVRPGRGRRPGRLRGGLAARHQLHVRHQPLRPVRAAPGLAACARGELPAAALHRTRPVPAHPPSAHGRVRGPVLGRAHDDRRASAVRRRRDGLHPARHHLRGTRPEALPRRGLPRLR